MLIKKVKQIIPIVAKVVSDLSSNSETDVPSVKAVNDTLATQDLTSEITLPDGIESNNLHLYRQGNVMNLIGMINFTTAKTGETILVNIPAKYVKEDVRSTIFGAGGTWLYGYINTSGYLNINEANGTWYGINITWII